MSDEYKSYDDLDYDFPDTSSIIKEYIGCEAITDEGKKCGIPSEFTNFKNKHKQCDGYCGYHVNKWCEELFNIYLYSTDKKYTFELEKIILIGEIKSELKSIYKEFYMTIRNKYESNRINIFKENIIIVDCSIEKINDIIILDLLKMLKTNYDIKSLKLYYKCYDDSTFNNKYNDDRTLINNNNIYNDRTSEYVNFLKDKNYDMENKFYLFTEDNNMITNFLLNPDTLMIKELIAKKII